MRILHLISHTHWDREWHEPFQVFRLRLAGTVDRVLDLLQNEPGYDFFMLDGQTIVLEDYLELRPEREVELKRLIGEGRILVGPWYVLPDEFLVSGEAIIRNLQRGLRTARQFGRSMPIGYIPDTFGHIGQMPQILKGSGLEMAALRRGLADEPSEVLWEGVDGTRILCAYLRDGYDNAAWLPQRSEGFVAELDRLAASLEPHAASGHILMMLGTDHMRPWPGLPARIGDANAALPDTRVVHSTLDNYRQAILDCVDLATLPVVHGELRNPRRHHLLPGVISSRMWIKQRNADCQNLLEQWAEPLAAVAMLLDPSFGDARPELQLAWKYLLQNHPHDSICGCSIDQVHAEMRPRFDWVDQIGGDIVQRALARIEEAVATGTDTDEGDGVAIVVLNPTAGPRTEAVTLPVDLPDGFELFSVLDEQGRRMPSVATNERIQPYFKMTTTPWQLRWVLGEAQAGSVEGMKLRRLSWQARDEELILDLTASNQGGQDLRRLAARLVLLEHEISRPEVKSVRISVHSPRQIDLTFLARDLPAYGYKTFRLVPGTPASVVQELDTSSVLENEYLSVEPDLEQGSLTVTDKTTGAVFAGLNRLTDGGDRGDLYNYCAPERDYLVNMPIGTPVISLLESNDVVQRLGIRSVYRVPASLAEDQDSRSGQTVELAISTTFTLSSGSRRVDFQTRIENTARDHRLRVEFPTGVRSESVLAAQAFDLTERGLDIPSGTRDWAEQPVGTAPMQQFVSVGDADRGAILAARGLPEYEVLRDDAGESTVALTLLRSVGWLSRTDLKCRQGNAGPAKPTPDAQQLGIHEFEYSFIPYSPSYLKGLEGGMGDEPEPLTRQAASMEARAFCSPVRARATDLHAGTLPTAAAWVQVVPPSFVVTAIKPPEQGTGIVVRGFNSSSARTGVRVNVLHRFAHAERVNLDEEPVAAMTIVDGQVEFDAAPREIVTIRFHD